jgi:hypothetical protein
VALVLSRVWLTFIFGMIFGNSELAMHLRERYADVDIDAKAFAEKLANIPIE